MEWNEMRKSLIIIAITLFAGEFLMALHGKDMTFGRYGGMLHAYYLKQFREAAEARRERLNRVRNKADAEMYVNSVRERIRQSFGRFPERTALNARITGQTVSGAFLIDRIIYESRPGFQVTGNFYKRRDLTGRCPGVLLLLGHSNSGKKAYQRVAQYLASCGYGVLAVDPVGQGERRQFSPSDAEITGCVSEHNMLGKKLHLLGENLSAWRVWDAIRGLDYLLSRPEIDSRHIGVTGCSGGGTLSAFVNALDPRVTMAAPVCYVTTFLRNLENENPVDSEQCPPCFLALQLDIGDFLIAAAPRPVMILAQDNDFFDPRGAEEVYREGKKIYSLLGCPENIHLVTGRGNHGYPVHHQEECAKFFNSLTGLSVRTDFVFAACSELDCYSGDGNRGKSVQDFLLDMLRGLPDTSKLSKPELAELAAEVLKISAPSVPDYTVLRTSVHDLNQKHLELETYFDRFGLKTEPGIQVTLKRLTREQLLFHPEFQARAVVFVPHLSTSPELREFHLTLREGRDLFSCEVRGIGESRPAETSPSCKTFFGDYGADYLYASSALMLDRPYLGRKVYDLLCALRFLKAHGVKEIHLIGNGQGAPVAAFAALFDPAVTHVTLHHAPESYRAIVEKRVTQWPLSIMPYGILHHFDLPDVYRAINAEIHDLSEEPSEMDGRQ